MCDSSLLGRLVIILRTALTAAIETHHSNAMLLFG
jgi:hypothetical protein